MQNIFVFKKILLYLKYEIKSTNTKKLDDYCKSLFNRYKLKKMVLFNIKLIRTVIDQTLTN